MVWTDTIQAAIMLLGLVVVCIMGNIKAGGLGHVYHTAKEIGRLNFDRLTIHHICTS